MCAVMLQFCWHLLYKAVRHFYTADMRPLNWQLQDKFCPLHERCSRVWVQAGNFSLACVKSMFSHQRLCVPYSDCLKLCVSGCVCVCVCVPADSWPSECGGWPHKCVSVRPLLSAVAQSPGHTAGLWLSAGLLPPWTDSHSEPNTHTHTHARTVHIMIYYCCIARNACSWLILAVVRLLPPVICFQTPAVCLTTVLWCQGILKG